MSAVRKPLLTLPPRGPRMPPIVTSTQVESPPAPGLPGPQVPITTPTFLTPFSFGIAQVIQGGAWPAVPVITIVITLSTDGIAFGIAGPTITYGGGVWKNKLGVIITESNLRFSLDSNIRAIRMTPTLLQAVSIGYRIATQP